MSAPKKITVPFATIDVTDGRMKLYRYLRDNPGASVKFSMTGRIVGNCDFHGDKCIEFEVKVDQVEIEE